MGKIYYGVCHSCKEYIDLDKFSSWVAHKSEYDDYADLKLEKLENYKNDWFIYHSLLLHLFMSKHQGHQIGVYIEGHFEPNEEPYKKYHEVARSEDIKFTQTKPVKRNIATIKLKKRKQEIYQMIIKICKILVKREKNYYGFSIYRDDQLIISYDESNISARCSIVPSEPSEYVFVVDHMSFNYQYTPGLWEQHLEELYKLSLKKEQKK